MTSSRLPFGDTFAFRLFLQAPPVGMTIGEYVIAAMKGHKSTIHTPLAVNIDQMDILNDLSADRFTRRNEITRLIWPDMTI